MTTSGTNTTTPTVRAARWLYRAAVYATMRATGWRYQARALACDLIDAWLPRPWHTPVICPLCRTMPRP